MSVVCPEQAALPPTPSEMSLSEILSEYRALLRTLGGRQAPLELASMMLRSGNLTVRGNLLVGTQLQLQDWANHMTRLVFACPACLRVRFIHEATVATEQAALAALGRQDDLARLPDEVLARVMGHLDPDDVASAARTCKRMSRVVRDPCVWREIFLRDWAASEEARGALIAAHGPGRDVVHWRAAHRETARAVKEFNLNPTRGASLEALSRAGLVPSPVTSSGMLHFFTSYQGISHRAISAFLSGRLRLHEETCWLYLTHLAPCLKLEGPRWCPLESLRAFLAIVALPGEAQLISNIIWPFARFVYARVAGMEDALVQCADFEALYVLLNAMLLMNTVLHNKNVRAKDRMPVAVLLASLRGLNTGTDFSEAYIHAAYESLRRSELRFSHGSYTAFRKDGVIATDRRGLTQTDLHLKAIAEARGRQQQQQQRARG